MRFWWVNQNQTWRQEVGGGYLWSPKLKSNKQLNPFYESMREVSPGDVILSFRHTLIAAIGIAYSHCYECPKPQEFGEAGRNWGDIGWKIDVRFVDLVHRIRPKDHIGELRRHLPSKYSPLSAAGDGSQSVYLTEVPEPLFRALAGLIGVEADQYLNGRPLAVEDRPSRVLPAQDTVIWEEHLKQEILDDPSIATTEKQAIVLARRGQGLFRQRVRCGAA